MPTAFAVVMQRQSYRTETVLSNKITRKTIVPSFEDSPRKPLRRRPSHLFITSTCHQPTLLVDGRSGETNLWRRENHRNFLTHERRDGRTNASGKECVSQCAKPPLGAPRAACARASRVPSVAEQGHQREREREREREPAADADEMRGLGSSIYDVRTERGVCKNSLNLQTN